MKRGITLLSVFTIAIVNVIGQTKPDSLFAKGNSAYASGEYDKAIKIYDSVVAKRYESGYLYLNIGNAYYKLRNYPKAILYYERALLIDPGNAKAKHNLAKAQIYTVDKINEIPEFLLTGWMHQLIMMFRSDTWAIISMIAFALCVVLFLVYFLSMKLSLKRTSFYSAIFLLFIACVTFYLSYKSKTLLINSNGAIVMTPTVTVKGSPSSSSTDLFIVHEGTKVYIMDKIDNWFEIKLADGKTGWLMKNDIEPI
jgi:hypothetical protein